MSVARMVGGRGDSGLPVSEWKNVTRGSQSILTAPTSCVRKGCLFHIFNCFFLRRHRLRVDRMYVGQTGILKAPFSSFCVRNTEIGT